MEKFSDVKTFRSYRMNLDATEENMAPGETREVYNMLEENNDGKITNMKGFVSVMSLPINSSFTMPSGQFKCIGTTRDIEGNSIIYFLCSIDGDDYHSILEMNTDTKALTWILKSEPLLNFQPGYKVKANVIEGLLYWTDGYFSSFLQNRFNPPRKINIAKAKAYTAAYPNRWQFTQVGEAYALTGYKEFQGLKYTAYVGSVKLPFAYNDHIVTWAMDKSTPEYRNKNISGYCTDKYFEVVQGTKRIIITDRPWVEDTDNSITISGYILPYSPGMYFGIDWQVMDVIKWKPQSAPGVSYATDLTQPINRLQNKLFQFCYRWVFDDHEKSVCSPVSDIPLPTKSELVTGIYDSVLCDNYISVWVDTGPMEVESIEILVREGNVGSWKIVHIKQKYDEVKNCILSNDIFNSYEFYNNELGENVDQADINRLYDVVPIIANNQDIIEKNRIIYANYKEGFDNIDVDVNLSSIQIEKEFMSGYKITFTKFTYPNIPPVGFSGNYIYSRGVKWFYNYVGTTFTRFFAGVRIDFRNVPLIPYSTYSFTVSTDNYYSYIKTPAEELEDWWDYPEINKNDFVGGTAIVTLGENPVLGDLLNGICQALRNLGSIGNMSVIACTGSNSFFNFENHIWFPWEDQVHGHELFNSEIFVLVGGGNGNATINLDKFTVTLGILNNLTTKCTTFKSGETKEFGIEYCDRAGRCTFINSNESCKIYIPSQIETIPAHKIYQNIIQWEINHLPPPEAEYYRWVMRKRISVPYYIQCPVYNISKSSTEGTVLTFIYISVFKNFTTTKKFFNKFNVAKYEWEPGDRLRFLLISSKGPNGEDIYQTFEDNLDFEIISVEVPSGTSTYLYDDDGDPILDADGNKLKDSAQSKLVIPYFDFTAYGITEDTLLTNTVIVEIYRIGKHVDSDVYYELSESFPILNPHSAKRLHSGGTTEVIAGWDRNQSDLLSARGTFDKGDAYMINRLMQNELFSACFPCESMSFSDWYNSDDLSIGLPNIENRNAYFQLYISNLRYGGCLIQDTRINDMSKFIGSDFISLADKYGAISHIEEVGYTLKILQKSKPSSLYIGRAGVTQPSADSKEILSSTKDVLGTLIVHDSDYGTVHPGSVVKNENRYYFFDFYAQAICRDAGNGIQDISEIYGIKSFLREKCELFGASDNVDVVAGFDQSNNIVFFSFIDLTTAANSFTIGFRDSGGRNEDGFTGFYQFVPDMYGTSKQVITSFKNNVLWLHNSNSVGRCNFYGTQFKYWFTIVTNKLPLAIKRYLGILVSSSKQLSSPDAGDIAIAETWNNPGGMKSLLKRGAFTSVQGKWVANFGKNMTTHQAIPVLWDLIDGDDLTGQSMSVRLEGEETVEHKVLSVEIQGVLS